MSSLGDLATISQTTEEVGISDEEINFEDIEATEHEQDEQEGLEAMALLDDVSVEEGVTSILVSTIKRGPRSNG